MSEPVVTIELPLSEAERLSNGLSDLLCIVRGIRIAKPKMASEFMGVSEAQDLNIKLKLAINKASD